MKVVAVVAIVAIVNLIPHYLLVFVVQVNAMAFVVVQELLEVGVFSSFLECTPFVSSLAVLHKVVCIYLQNTWV